MKRTRLVGLLCVLAVAGTLLAPSTVAGRIGAVLRSHTPIRAAAPYIGTRPSSGSGVSAAGLNIQSTSTNWSGYTVQTSFPTGASGSVSDVKASWIVPQVTGGTTDAYSANWIGIDGYSSPTVEQIGTEQDWISGAPFYAAWWEMYPGGSVSIDTLDIGPGDVMNAEVRWISASQFSLTLIDVTKAQGFQTVQTMPGGAQRRSAEWVVEAPADASGILPLADMGPSSFTSCDVTVNGVEGPIGGAGWAFDAMTMISANGGATLARPSSLTAAGTAFVVTEPGGVDRVPPTTVSDVVSSYDNVAIAHLTAVDNPGGSGVAATHYRVDGGATQTGVVVTIPTYGPHALTFWSVDNAGNVETAHTTSLMVNDTIPPTTVSDAATTYAGPASIRLTATDNAGGSGLAATYYIVDGVVRQTYVGAPVTVTSAGSHTMTFWSVDNAGNVEATRSASFAIVGVRRTTATLRASAGSLLRYKYVGLYGTLSGGAAAGAVVRYEVRKPGSTRYVLAATRVVSGSGASSYRYKLMARGTYYFRLRFLGSPGFAASTSPAVRVVSR